MCGMCGLARGSIFMIFCPTPGARGNSPSYFLIFPGPGRRFTHLFDIREISPGEFEAPDAADDLKHNGYMMKLEREGNEMFTVNSVALP